MSTTQNTTIPSDLDSCLNDANIKPAQIAAKFGTDFLRNEIRQRLVSLERDKKVYAERMRAQRKGVAKLGKSLTQSILAEVMQTPTTTESTTLSSDDIQVVNAGDFGNDNDANGNYVNQG